MEKILIKLKELRNDFTIDNLDKIIEGLEKELKEKEWTNKGGKKVQLGAIKRVLSNAVNPALKNYSPLKDGRVVVTDGYQLYIIDKKSLPFSLAYNKDWTREEKEIYELENADVFTSVAELNYPNILNVIPTTDVEEQLSINVSDIVRLYKTTPKDKDSRCITWCDKICINVDYLKNLIDIFGIKDGAINLDFRGSLLPVVFKQDKNVALIMPVKKF